MPAVLSLFTSTSHFELNAPSKTAFLLSAERPIIPLNISDNSVSRSFAFSKSPTMISQLWVHPDWAASFNVSNNWVKVFTFVAASFAVCPIFMMDLICSSVYPMVLSCFSFRSPVNFESVSVKMSDVSQPLLNVSRKEPSFSIIWSIAIPCTLAVSFRES